MPARCARRSLRRRTARSSSNARRGSPRGSSGWRERDRRVLLDLCLPDSQGIATFEQVWRAAPHIPILVIGSPDDQDVARQAVKRGAQDYLRKDHLDSYSLPRALRHIIERKAAEEALFLEQQRAEVTLNSIGDAVLSTDRPGQRDLSQSGGRTHDRLVAPGSVGPAARRGLPDHRRRDTRTGSESDGAGRFSSTRPSA